MGCDKTWWSRLQPYLGQTGVVVRVEPLKVQLKHHDGALEWWGHGALRKCLTAAEVDAMEVRLEMFNVGASACNACCRILSVRD